MNFLIVKQWGYQTICPDEENTTGYYKVEGYESYGSFYGYKKPSLCSEKHEISHIVYGDSLWDGQKNTIIEMDMIGLRYQKNQYIGCLKKFLINKIYLLFI